MNVAKQLVQVY